MRVARAWPGSLGRAVPSRGPRSCSTTIPEATPPRRQIPDDGKTLADFLPKKNSLARTTEKKPPWLKMYNPNLNPEAAERYKMVRATVKNSGLATVCQEARCPNVGECWSSGTATVMIMGDTCTRGCRFCSVATSRTPPPPQVDEPEKLAAAVAEWGMDYIVVTMVDRDDLADQGAAHIAKSVRELKEKAGVRVETLIGDMQGQLHLVEQVVRSGMDVFAHNIETVDRLQKTVRDRRAGYQQTLSVLRHAKEVRPDLVTKSSVMLGLGEAPDEVRQCMRDLREAGVDILTFGQYLQPTKRHMKVDRYVTPEEFDMWKIEGENLGFHVASGPLVRSSYKAGELFQGRLDQRADTATAKAEAGVRRLPQEHVGDVSQQASL